MRKLLLFGIALVAGAGCGALKPVETVPAQSLAGRSFNAGGYVRQDTIKVVSADPLRDSLQKDSVLRDSLLRDSLMRDSLIRDSIIRDSIVRDSVEKAAAAREAIRYDFSPVYQTDLHVPSAQAIPAGQYSGITYLGDNRYAVVHDKLNGGGIVFFDIVLSDNGRVKSASATVPEFTSGSKVTGRDNEGVAFVPSSGTMFISSESGQTITEYTLEGKETGRSLKVPAAFAKDKINSNNGFEALTYNSLTKTFWTTTETPLKADGKESRLLRLQSFGSDLKAKKQYLYKMDAPAKSAAEGATAKAYIHGVPALVALDDGSLIVLEREVYVPNGGLVAKALGSFTRTKLYVVNPSDSTKKNAASGTVLEKSLMVQFTTASLNLANFEGMCLGPDLPGGWHTLILIADSQGGSNGLTAEYIKIIAFK
ncbi:MAG: esterase-like activity of phytase family protein [Bacteroidales bacterium]|nr:esterase-like activity of phytase family protein [Bacteroidales bacterium]